MSYYQTWFYQAHSIPPPPLAPVEPLSAGQESADVMVLGVEGLVPPNAGDHAETPPAAIITEVGAATISPIFDFALTPTWPLEDVPLFVRDSEPLFGTVIVYTSVGKFFLYTAAQWATGVLLHLEATFRSANGGQVAVRLYDETDDAAVADSKITKTSTTLARHRSSALTLTDGNEYRAQVGVAPSDAGAATGASIVGLSP